MATPLPIPQKDTRKEVPCKICERPTLLRESHLCSLCSALIQNLVVYTPEARERLEAVVARESSWI